MVSQELEYAGFWIRVWASIIDTLLLGVLVYPLLTAIYGDAYWMARQATPGKMAIAARIVDAKTGNNSSTVQLLIRDLGYFVSTIPLFLGIFWVAFDSRKQGWDDKMAGTVAVRKKSGTTRPVEFEA